MRKPIIAGNWKMNKDISEAIELVKEIKEKVKDIKDVETVVIPPFIDLSEVLKVLEGSDIALGAQNCYWINEGAYTGEIGPKMLKNLGCTYVVIGHSERRTIFKEDDDTVNKKIRAALTEGLLPIMCVGELLEERETNKTFTVIERQIKEGLKNISAEEMLNIVIAYEPVWAIGTGKTATPEQAQEVHKYIRGLLAEIYDANIADKIRIQYGGSVKPDNVEGIMVQPDVDGALVGGASLKAEPFFELVKRSSKE